MVNRVADILPVAGIRVEVASFDTQAMKAGISHLPNWTYQQGELYRQENIKAYVRKRDKYTCAYCGEIFPERLEIDHITPRSRGGTTTPDNLVCSCHSCNQRKGSNTADEFGYPKLQANIKKRSLKAAAHTQSGKTATLEGLSKIAHTEITYGYLTKIHRKAMGLSKTHYNDAVAIASGGRSVTTLAWYEACRAVQKGNYRQCRGKHSERVASLPREVFGFRQYDKVRLPDGQVIFVNSRRSSGQFSVSTLEGKTVRGSITHRKLTLVQRASTLLTEIRHE